MSIECLNVLDASLKEKLAIVKENILFMGDISYKGVQSQFETEEEKITIYNLLPGLEEAEVVVKKEKGKDKSHAYIIKNGLLAKISENSLNQLLNDLNIVVALIENGDFQTIKELDIIPKEIKEILQTIDRISTKESIKRIDLLYQKYCLTIKQLRQIQAENLYFQMYSQKLSR